jgi:DNA-directed RNA polymerase subunit RPC12/RpoP
MSMVKQTRIIFGPQDLVQIRIHCGSCSGELTFPIERLPKLPTECPHCGGRLLEGGWGN